MIKVKNSVPSVYYNSSRDFQLLGHFFDLVLNAVKTEADILFSLPLSTNSPDQLLDLMAFTLGLRLDKSKYNVRQLRAICSVAPKMMRTKGSLTSVNILCTALMHADSIEGDFSVNVSEDGTALTVSISSLATCADILYEILPYIIPAGMVFNIKQSNSYDIDITDQYAVNDRVSYAQGGKDYVLTDSEIQDLELAQAGMFKTNSTAPVLMDNILESTALVPSVTAAEEAATQTTASVIEKE